MSAEAVVVKIHPESPTHCGGCHLLKGINFATCQAGFTPVFSGRVTLRPQECVDAAETVAVARRLLSTLDNLP